jgi:hypothetical protein
MQIASDFNIVKKKMMYDAYDILKNIKTTG